VRIVHADDVAPSRWKNGGGVTRELLAAPAGDGWRVRISVAQIERDGPFSAFLGVQRWFVVLKGAGVELSFDGAITPLTRSDAPFAFDGGAAPGCRLIDGPTLDLNLMLRDAVGRMEIADDGLAWAPSAAQCGLFTAVHGRCVAGAESVELAPYTLAWFDAAPESLTFTADQRPAGAIGWWIAAT
jgi:environmental stress-induced protein Ves